jgi:hypothetical protein
MARSSGVRRRAQTVMPMQRSAFGSPTAVNQDLQFGMGQRLELPMRDVSFDPNPGEFDPADMDRPANLPGDVSEGQLKTPLPVKHGDNLIALVPPERLQKLGADLVHEVEVAQRAREPWLRIMQEGIKRLGFDRQADTRSNPFPGSSAVTHPAFAQACIDLQARVSSQLCPPSGPAKCVVIGEETPELADRADRVADFLNYQCTKQIREWRSETERCLMMVGPEGSTFKKQWFDRTLRRPRVAYIPAENIIIPYGASDHMTSPLVAEIMRKMRGEVRRHIKSGDWAKHEIGMADSEGHGDIAEAADRVVGQQSSGEQLEEYDHYTYYECQVTRRIAGIDGNLEGEYLVTVQKSTMAVVAIRRNWSQDDPIKERFHLLHHYKAWPWRGVYGIGLYHLIGGLSKAATGALRAILDSAHWQNAPGGYRLKASRQSGGKIVRAPGDVVEIEAPPGVHDIRDVIMADPHPGPSPVLFELLGFLADAASSFANVALTEVAESNANVPVGTTMARLDEASRVFSGLYQRLHEVQGQELQALYEIDRATIDLQLTVLPSSAPLVRQPGPPPGPDMKAEPGDFNVSINVMPVSDPHTHSAIQRTMQHQARLDLARAAMSDGVKVDIRGAYVDAARGMQLPEPESLFPEDPPPLPPGDPFSENLKLAQGAQITAGGDQDHDIHLMVHLARLSLPMTIGTPAGGALLAHIEQHLTYGAVMLDLTHNTAPALAKAKGIPDAGEWYQGWIEQLQPLLVPPADPGVAALAKAEEAKVEADKERTAIETDAKKQIVAVETAAKLKVVDAQLGAKLQEIDASHDEHALTEGTKLQTSREANASRERVAAAQIGAKAAEPPPPKPAGNSVAKKTKR